MIEDNHLSSERGGEDQSSRFFSPLLSPWKISKHRRVEISHAATNKFLDGSSSFQRNANIDLIDDIATIFAYVFNTVKGWKDFGCEIRHHSSSRVKRIILILSRSISLHFSYFRLLWPYFTGQHRRTAVHKTENSRIIRGIRLSIQGRGGRLFHGGGRDWSVTRRCAFRPLFARVEPEGHFKSDASLFVCGDPDGGAALFPSSRVISRPIFSLCAYLFLAPPLPIFPPAIDDARFLSGWPEKKETLLSILSPNGLPTIAHTFPSPPIITDHWPRFANLLSSLETALSFEMEMERILR